MNRMPAMFKGLILLVFLFQLRDEKTYGQQLVFSDSSGNFSNPRYCTIAGKLNNSYIIIENLPLRRPHVIVFDTGCVLKKEYQLLFIPPGGFIKASLLPDHDEWSILWQYARGRTWFLYQSVFNENCEPIGGFEPIDSIVVPVNASLSPFYVRNSPFHNFDLLFRKTLDTANNQLKIDLTIFSAVGGKVSKGRISMPFESELDQTGDLFIDETGNVFTSICDRALNYRLGSTIKLYEYLYERGQVNYPPIISKKKPATITILPEVSDHSVLLVGLYVDFYSKNISGLLYTKMEIAQKKPDSVYYYAFTKEEKKELNKQIAGIPGEKLMNYLELKQCIIPSENKLSVLIQLSRGAYGKNNISSPLESKQEDYTISNYGNYGHQSLNTSPPGSELSRVQEATNMTGLYGNAASIMLLSPLSSYEYTERKKDILYNNNSVFGNPNIPVTHVSYIASFDRQFKLLNKKILRSQSTSAFDYIAPFVLIKNGICSRFNYEGTEDKLRLKKTETSLLSDQLRENVQPVKNPFLLLLDHPFLYADNNFILTFYHNLVTGSYGLAKYSW